MRRTNLVRRAATLIVAFGALTFASTASATPPSPPFTQCPPVGDRVGHDPLRTARGFRRLSRPRWSEAVHAGVACALPEPLRAPRRGPRRGGGGPGAPPARRRRQAERPWGRGGALLGGPPAPRGAR